MIFINDEKPEEYPEQHEFLKEKLQEIKNRVHIPKGEKEYVFIDPKPTRFGDKGKAEPKQNIQILHRGSFNGVTWTYCTNSWTDSKDGSRKYSPYDT